MRRIIATLLVTGLLSTSAPLFARDRGGRGEGGDFSPIRIIKTIIRHLIPVPTDGGDLLGPPKP